MSYKGGKPAAPAAPSVEEPAVEGSAVRLQKYLARAGVASRRSAEELITSGRVTVNGVPADKLGTKVNPETDVVCVDGRIVSPDQEHVTLILNKPAGVVTTMDDPQGRPCVAGLVPADRYPSLFPVGRLDRDTSGVLLFSTDGELGNGLLHPSRKVDKTYLALVEGVPNATALELLRNGLPLEDGMTAPAKVAVLTGEDRIAALEELGSVDEAGTSGVLQRHGGRASREALEEAGTVLSVTIHEGRNRQVRRMFAAVGNPVIALHRRSFAGLTAEGIARGSWRILSQEEVCDLKRAFLE